MFVNFIGLNCCFKSSCHDKKENKKHQLKIIKCKRFAEVFNQ